MKDPNLEAEKAENWQSIKALLIPFTLFLACLGAAAGGFLLYNQEPLGWLFIVISGTVIIADIIGLIRFQNKYRAKGIFDNRFDK